MDAPPDTLQLASVRVLPHIQKLDDCFGQFLVRVVCDCGACREIEPEALARSGGWKITLKHSPSGCAARGAGKRRLRSWQSRGPDPEELSKNPR